MGLASMRDARGGGERRPDGGGSERRRIIRICVRTMPAPSRVSSGDHGFEVTNVVDRAWATAGVDCVVRWCDANHRWPHKYGGADMSTRRALAVLTSPGVSTGEYVTHDEIGNAR